MRSLRTVVAGPWTVWLLQDHGRVVAYLVFVAEGVGALLVQVHALAAHHVLQVLVLQLLTLGKIERGTALLFRHGTSRTPSRPGGAWRGAQL